ncbi:DUF1673 domain-containing protein [Methanosarcina sp. T3]|uniref:DUF1673 domain-containing protein n=1 Tax=Methanosarcina sp. T3 TaxID=3439062 RepID=UPI003F83EAC2
MAFIESIRKMMGWCPNARAHETRHPLHSKYFVADIPTRGGDTGNSENLSWFRKLSSRILLVDSFLTLIYFLVMPRLGVNIAALLAGFFIFVIIFIFDWKKQMHRYDTIAQKLILDNSGMKKLFRIMNLIFYVMLFCWIFYWSILGDVERDYLMEKILPFFEGILSFFAGGLASMWLGCLQILYWEKKNHKTIYLDKRYGKWKNSYIIREGR